MAGPYDYIPGMMPQEVTGPQPTQDSQPADLTTQWKSWLENPVNRNMMLGAGMQLMMGSWGSPIASAMGAGIESAAGTEKLMQDEAIRQEGVANKLGEAETERGWKSGENQLDRQAAQQRADTMSSTRLQTSGARANNSAFNTAYRTKMQALQIPLLSGEITQEEAEGLALAAAERAAASAPAGYVQPGNSASPGQGASTNGVQQPSVGGTGTPPPAAGSPSPGQQTKALDYNYLLKTYGADSVTPERLEAAKARGYTITNMPGEKAKPNPSFKGLEDGTKTAPFKSRDKAGAGDWYITASGKKARKGLFKGLEKEED